MARQKNPYKRVVRTRVPESDGIEVHVSTVEVAGVPLVEVREFIVGAGLYGRGIAMKPETWDLIVDLTVTQVRNI